VRVDVYAVVLPRGTVSVPLDFDTFERIAAVPDDPAKKIATGVDPGKVLRGEQDLSLVTRVHVLHAAAGKGSPGVREILAMGTDRDFTLAIINLMVKLLQTLSPETAGVDGPKA
jgi:hypothetical protein